MEKQYSGTVWAQRGERGCRTNNLISEGQVVCYTAVFSVVTQRSFWGGALRDDTKNAVQTKGHEDHYTFLGNCQPTHPLSQHFALSENRC